MSKWTCHTHQRTCSVEGSRLVGAHTESSHRQAGSYPRDLRGLCTTLLRTIADSTAWEALKPIAEAFGRSVVVTRHAGPNTDTHGARRCPWLWYRRSPTCPRFGGRVSPRWSAKALSRMCLLLAGATRKTLSSSLPRASSAALRPKSRARISLG